MKAHFGLTSFLSCSVGRFWSRHPVFLTFPLNKHVIPMLFLLFPPRVSLCYWSRCKKAPGGGVWNFPTDAPPPCAQEYILVYSFKVIMFEWNWPTEQSLPSRSSMDAVTQRFPPYFGPEQKRIIAFSACSGTTASSPTADKHHTGRAQSQPPGPLTEIARPWY